LPWPIATERKSLRTAGHDWKRDPPGNLGEPAGRHPLQHVEPHEPDKLLVHQDALLSQSVDDRLWRGVQAEAKEGVSDCPFRADGAPVVILPTGRPIRLRLSLLLR
jgi:hypothetical protein